MAWDNPNLAPTKAHNAMSRFTELRVAIPKKVATAYDGLKRIEAQTATHDRHGVRDAVLSGADDETLRQLALAELAAPIIADARANARLHASIAVLDAIADSASEIHTGMAKLAQKAIQVLEGAAKVADVPMNRLVLDGRHDDATLVAQSETTAAQLDRLFTLRDRLLWDKRRPVVDVSRWKSPEHAGMAFIEGIHAGGTIWFPDQATAIDHGQRLAAAAYDEPVEAPA
jgi:hypothetical protein